MENKTKVRIIKHSNKMFAYRVGYIDAYIGNWCENGIDYVNAIVVIGSSVISIDLTDVAVIKECEFQDG